MSEIAQVVGKQIRLLRQSKGLSLEKCAESADMSITFLGEVERGRKEPSLRTLQRLSTAMELPLSAFIVGLENDVKTQGVSKHELLERLGNLLADLYTEPEAQALCQFATSLRC